MSKKYALLSCLVLVVCAMLSFPWAYAENIWVDESWHHLSQTMALDGEELVFDAEVLDVPANAEAREYYALPITDDFIRRRMQEIDWEKLGCGMQNPTWYPDPPGYLGFGTEEGGLRSNGSISRPGSIVASSASEYSLYVKINNGYEDFDNSCEPLGSLSYQDMTACAEGVAAACGFKLGKPVRSQRFTDVKGIYEAFETVHSPISPEAAEGYQFITLFYPVYFQGLRLFSGRMPPASGNTQIIPMELWLTISRDHGPVHIQGPLLDAARFTPMGQPQRVLTEEELIECVKRYYENMPFQKTARILVHTMTLEYVPITVDSEIVENYTLYPVWVLEVTYEHKDGAKFTVNIGFHAATGQPLF